MDFAGDTNDSPGQSTDADLVKQISAKLHEVKKEVQCPICLGTLRAPVFATCRHTFCRQCFDAAAGKELNCPICRQELNQRSAAAGGDLLEEQAKRTLELFRRYNRQVTRHKYPQDNIICDTQAPISPQKTPLLVSNPSPSSHSEAVTAPMPQMIHSGQRGTVSQSAQPVAMIPEATEQIVALNEPQPGDSIVVTAPKKSFVSNSVEFSQPIRGGRGGIVASSSRSRAKSTPSSSHKLTYSDHFRLIEQEAVQLANILRTDGSQVETLKASPTKARRRSQSPAKAPMSTEQSSTVVTGKKSRARTMSPTKKARGGRQKSVESDRLSTETDNKPIVTTPADPLDNSVKAEASSAPQQDHVSSNLRRSTRSHRQSALMQSSEFEVTPTVRQTKRVATGTEPKVADNNSDGTPKNAVEEKLKKGTKRPSASVKKAPPKRSRPDESDSEKLFGELFDRFDDSQKTHLESSSTVAAGSLKKEVYKMKTDIELTTSPEAIGDGDRLSAAEVVRGSTRTQRRSAKVIPTPEQLKRAESVAKELMPLKETGALRKHMADRGLSSVLMIQQYAGWIPGVISSEKDIDGIASWLRLSFEDRHSTKGEDETTSEPAKKRLVFDDTGSYSQDTFSQELLTAKPPLTTISDGPMLAGGTSSSGVVSEVNTETQSKSRPLPKLEQMNLADVPSTSAVLPFAIPKKIDWPTETREWHRDLQESSNVSLPLATPSRVVYICDDDDSQVGDTPLPKPERPSPSGLLPSDENVAPMPHLSDQTLTAVVAESEPINPIEPVDVTMNNRDQSEEQNVAGLLAEIAVGDGTVTVSSSNSAEIAECLKQLEQMDSGDVSTVDPLPQAPCSSQMSEDDLIRHVADRFDAEQDKNNDGQNEKSTNELDVMSTPPPAASASVLSTPVVPAHTVSRVSSRSSTDAFMMEAADRFENQQEQPPTTVTFTREGNACDSLNDNDLMAADDLLCGSGAVMPCSALTDVSVRQSATPVGAAVSVTTTEAAAELRPSSSQDMFGNSHEDETVPETCPPNDEQQTWFGGAVPSDAHFAVPRSMQGAAGTHTNGMGRNRPPDRHEQTLPIATSKPLQMTPIKMIISGQANIPGLNKDLLKQFESRFRVKQMRNMTPDVTHVIVRTEDNDMLVCADRTLKFVWGIAAKKMVVSHRWVFDSSNSGVLLNAEQYEVKRDKIGVVDGRPRASRLDVDGRLLTNYSIHIPDVFHGCYVQQDNTYIICDGLSAQLVGLVTLMGGDVVDTIDMMPPNVPQQRRRSFVLFPATEWAAANHQLMRAPVPLSQSLLNSIRRLQLEAVSYEWLFDLITKYALDDTLSYYRYSADIAYQPSAANAQRGDPRRVAYPVSTNRFY